MRNNLILDFLMEITVAQVIIFQVVVFAGCCWGMYAAHKKYMDE